MVLNECESIRRDLSVLVRTILYDDCMFALMALINSEFRMAVRVEATGISVSPTRLLVRAEANFFLFLIQMLQPMQRLYLQTRAVWGSAPLRPLICCMLWVMSGL